MLLFLALLTQPLAAQPPTQIDIQRPPGSTRFGRVMTILSNGNIVVAGTIPGGRYGLDAIYLYNGVTGALISTLTEGPFDTYALGSGGVIELSNGNYLVVSLPWEWLVGAVTWGNGVTGVSGVVNSTNSLVGAGRGTVGVIALSNGNYVVISPSWGNSKGAVTWANGATGISGVVNSTNSLVGSTAGDPECCSETGDQVGSYGIITLSNGNYVVSSLHWANGMGAVTWGNGATGISGVVNSANSLVGSTPDDRVGESGVTPLSNGNYVVVVPSWDNGVVKDIGAVTWGNGASGVIGQINNSNSVLGITVYGGRELNFAYDAIRLQLVVGRPYDNIVTLFRSLPNTFPYKIFLSLVRN